MNDTFVFDPALPIKHNTTSTSSHLQSAGKPAVGALILSAALSLPGLQSAAHAETAPERGSISLRYLDYKDSQPGLDRITSHSPSISIVAPIAGVWAIEGAMTHDAVSGASPTYHTAISGASRMSDNRTAEDLRVTRYFSQGSFAVGMAQSNEHDYVSKAISLHATASDESKNTTWSFGISHANDSINPVNNIVKDESKKTLEFVIGVTQVMTRQDIVQVNLGYTHGLGYFNDPYKFPDNRPRERNQKTFQTGWNHHFGGLDGTARLSYRYYIDSFDIKAHTINSEYVQQLPHGWSATPSLRLYTQTAASFYYDPIYNGTFGAPFPPGYVFGGNQFFSADQRMSGFGARTFGIKLAKQLNTDWMVDVKYEDYQQRNGWQKFGHRSMDLATLSARSIQVGLTRGF